MTYSQGALPTPITVDICTHIGSDMDNDIPRDIDDIFSLHFGAYNQSFTQALMDFIVFLYAQIFSNNTMVLRTS